MIREPSFGTAESEVYGEVLDALKRAGIRYMLGGAVALNAYTGIWRETKDLDVFVPENTVASILETLEAAGFETEITDPCWLAKAWKGSPFVDIVHANQNGALPVEESWFSNAKEATVLSRRVLVIPAEEMTLSKMFVASRDQWDMSDVVHLIFATHGDLDWGRILSGIGEHWELLLAYFHLYRYVYPSHTHYLPRRVLELLRERYVEEGDSQGSLRFRGTMLDDASFRVDVEEWGLPDERAATREALCSDEQQR
ncbi:MAG: nucleotidyltransferase [Rubrobacter sp.]|nr:nucleotidyltransferase [Rubrobacter sp.]